VRRKIIVEEGTQARQRERLLPLMDDWRAQQRFLAKQILTTHLVVVILQLQK
jgi:hypothetical protein